MTNLWYIWIMLPVHKNLWWSLKKWEEYYQTINANVHRGIHTLSQLATEEMELSRQKIQKFINAKYSHENHFHSWNHREYQPNLLLHNSTDKAGEWNHYFSSGTPLKHRSLADALRENRCCFEGYPDGRKTEFCN